MPKWKVGDMAMVKIWALRDDAQVAIHANGNSLVSIVYDRHLHPMPPTKTPEESAVCDWAVSWANQITRVPSVTSPPANLLHHALLLRDARTPPDPLKELVESVIAFWGGVDILASIGPDSPQKDRLMAALRAAAKTK